MDDMEREIDYEALEKKVSTDLKNLPVAAKAANHLYNRNGYYQATIETLLAMQNDIADIVENLKKLQSM